MTDLDIYAAAIRTRIPFSSAPKERSNSIMELWLSCGRLSIITLFYSRITQVHRAPNSYVSNANKSQENLKPSTANIANNGKLIRFA